MELVAKKSKKKKDLYINISAIEKGFKLGLVYIKNKKDVDNYIKLKNIVHDYNLEIPKNKFEYNLLKKLLYDGYGVVAYYFKDGYKPTKKLPNGFIYININNYCLDDFEFEEEVVIEILEKMRVLININDTYSEEIRKNLEEMKEIKSNLLDKKIRLIK